MTLTDVIAASMHFFLQPMAGSPAASPQKDKYGDRFIPSRAGAAWHINFNMIQENKTQSPTLARKAKELTAETGKDGAAYNCLLKNELLGAGIEDLKVSSAGYLIGEEPSV